MEKWKFLSKYSIPNLFGIDHVLIVLNLNSSKALKMLPIGTMDLLYVIESASQTRKTIGHAILFKVG